MNQASESGSGAADERDSKASPSDLLRVTREQRGLTIDDVADELHLDPAVVATIESGDLESLGAPVFVKGYLRGYARLLELDEQSVIAGYMPAEHDPDQFKTVSIQRELKAGASLSMFVLWMALVLLVLIAMVYLLMNDGEPDASASADFAEQPARVPVIVEPRPEFVSQPVEPEPVVSPPPQPAVDAIPAATESRVQAEPAVLQDDQEPEPAPPPVAADTVSLTLKFSEECWVELSDSRRRLLYGLEKPGSRRVFDARPPFRFFLGNADAVEIVVGGNEYVIPRAARTGRNTARFELSRDAIEAGL